MTRLTSSCCVVGGGPAGMMLGLLLARAGVEVVVLEKHADFLRDFRGDTIHPSTLEVMHELGLIDEFLKLPHQQVRSLRGIVGHDEVELASFAHLPTHSRFLAFMPQWHFLDFLAREARRYPGFRLVMEAEVSSLLDDEQRVTGVLAETPQGRLEVVADLVVGADGRHSLVREQAGLEPVDLGAPMDVLWLRLSRKPSDPAEAFGHIDQGRMLVMIDRGDYWQCALLIAKGSFGEVRQRGLDALRLELQRLSPWLGHRVQEIADWNDVKLLTVRMDHLRRWSRPGLLCIGDAAHAMSPVGGVGINLAIQDAVAAANLLAGPLREQRVDARLLARVQRRREWPARLTQWLQMAIQQKVIAPALAGHGPQRLPRMLALFNRFAVLRRLPGYLIGVGVRPEHVRLPAEGRRRPWTPAAEPARTVRRSTG